MIYVFAGTNSERRSIALNKFLKRFDDYEVSRFDEYNFTENLLGDFIGSSGLFSKKSLVVFENLLEGAASKIILEKVEALGASETIFVFSEREISKEASGILKKEAEEFEIFDLAKARDSRFNIFQITDAFGARDKKATWVLMQKALRENIEAVEILNILIWQVKNLLFVRGVAEKETGLNPFVYRKSTAYTKNFKDGELENISKGLVKLFHESHLGLDLAPNLELLVLKSL